ncbi:MAG: hypothetical protein A2928_02370 [Candidatus Taylorbacteria bacterium RIFCSPLOWO2_01_FULL_45_15b]|uniref:Uncharacterized protein n=1 Tax=Candidatus Taylorbacteria bacterium RIFCSPLOWO2_01_FULL_45_15b TaxID=1802319 RepID=A0A1G2NHP9_9BACT|nr:MAG: hypothetical protein A2928_02370 [Candidatus Taylorbacteria bacterium RIFCSPLOWO2_01_FULL_45_15b]
MREEHDKLKALVQKQQLESVCKADSPEIATNIATTGCVEMACAIIDSLDEVTAAFIIGVLRQRAESDGRGASYSSATIVRAEELQIKGLKGLCDARAKLYKETGQWAGV